MPQLSPSVGGYASNTPFIMIIPGLFPDILRIYPIIPEYSLILLTTYYAQNYAGIIEACLVVEEFARVLSMLSKVLLFNSFIYMAINIALNSTDSLLHAASLLFGESKVLDN